MNTKRCSKCKIEKPFNFFNICKFGLNSWCKKCKNKQTRQWYLKNRKKVLEYAKKYARKHKKEIEQYIKDHREEALKRGRIYYINHREEIKLKKQKYNNRHKTARNSKNRNKRLTDMIFKLIGNLRCRIYQAMKNNYKSKHTTELLGCSIEFLKRYLENQFTKGMTWDNYGRGKGKWNIDHIKPCASFDLIKPKEQKKCFHYTNLQPLWAEENIKKGAK